MTPNERQELETLLPWHAAGTLGPVDAARVEAALAASSSSPTSFRRRSAESALNRVIARSQVETADRPSNFPA